MGKTERVDLVLIDALGTKQVITKRFKNEPLDEDEEPLEPQSLVVVDASGCVRRLIMPDGTEHEFDISQRPRAIHGAEVRAWASSEYVRENYREQHEVATPIASRAKSPHPVREGDSTEHGGHEVDTTPPEAKRTAALVRPRTT